MTGHDGASNVSSEAVGVPKTKKNNNEKKKCEKAIYSHCCGNNLKLVITTAFKIPIIQKFRYLRCSKGSHYDVREGKVWRI